MKITYLRETEVEYPTELDLSKPQLDTIDRDRTPVAINLRPRKLKFGKLEIILHRY